jgi:hypothetical protein
VVAVDRQMPVGRLFVSQWMKNYALRPVAIVV